MTHVALFPSVLGVRQGILDTAEVLRANGHSVLVVDLYDGRVFNDYDAAIAYAQGEVGEAVLAQQALAAVTDIPDGFVSMGFSMGCAMAVYVATQRAVSGVVMIAGSLPASVLGPGLTWPAGVPAQTHSTLDDPWREPEMLELTIAEAAADGHTLEVFDYPGSGHLFNDATLPAEYDAARTELMWSRVLPFVAAAGAREP